jgi:hypothetical protein
MRALSIVVQHIVVELGQSVARRHHGKLFSVVDDGEFISGQPLPFGLILSSTRFSVLPALSLNNGIIHCDIVEGAFDSDLFYQFISRLLDQMEPFPGQNSVIVMDNCRIHKNPAILDLIEER